MKKYIIIATALLSLTACETFDLDKDLQNPNFLTLDQADPDKLLNSIQVNLSSVYLNASDIGMSLTRMANTTNSGQWSNYLTPTSSTTMWYGYVNVINASELLRKNNTGKNLFHHDGMSRVLEAYTLLTLVDFFGDVPLSEALKGNANTNPKADSGEDVYNYAIKLLNDAKADFAKTPFSRPKNDLFYPTSGTLADPVKWTKLANSLLFKAYLNTDNTAQLSTLMSAPLLGDGDDFVFRYSTNDANPDSRNPYWVGNYRSTGAGDYMANYFMWLVNQEKAELKDPRRRYYFYRQVSDASSATPAQLPCKVATKPSHYGSAPFCYLDYGYWGRDMGDNSGIPPDSTQRTTWGPYPFGGRFDANNYAAVSDQQGEKGAGILPILTANFIEFMKAEAMLRLGVAGDAKATMLGAIDKNLNYVKNLFPQTATQAMTAQQITDYKTLVTGIYDAAGSNANKLAVSTKEFFIASFGNGIEAYNMYRRTGSPNNMQPMLTPNPGNFPNSIYYPNSYTENNSNAKQKATMDVKVFWDKGTRVLK